jgi:hypothetical protein
MIARNSQWITSIFAASAAAIALITAPTASHAQDILLGGVGPLSQPGDVAGGQEMKWAMEQAVADLNAKGGVMGRKLRLNFYDTQNKPDVCAAIAKKMVQDDKVLAVVGEFHSGCGLAQIPTYNQAGTPVVFSETYNDKITGGDPADPNLPPNPPTIFASRRPRPTTLTSWSIGSSMASRPRRSPTLQTQLTTARARLTQSRRRWLGQASS